jgi:hypothetical protein
VGQVEGSAFGKIASTGTFSDPINLDPICKNIMAKYRFDYIKNISRNHSMIIARHNDPWHLLTLVAGYNENRINKVSASSTKL